MVVLGVWCRTDIYVLEIRKPLCLFNQIQQVWPLSNLSTRQDCVCTVAALLSKINTIFKINYKFITNFERIA